MFGGGGGMNPRKMKQMMEQMGIDMEDIDAQEVIIRTPDEELVFDDAEVQLMEAQGQKTYQVVGEPESRELGSGEGSAAAAEGSAAAAEGDSDETDSSSGVDEDDVELVAMRAGVDEDTAREALEANDGDLADAVDELE
jgi:nascent polypeptide-associated complex subunit alpha